MGRSPSGWDEGGRPAFRLQCRGLHSLMDGLGTFLEGTFGAMGHPVGGWEVQVTTSTGFGYPVRVGRGILDRLAPLLQELSPAHAYALIADGRVFDLHGDRISELCSGLSRPLTVHTFPPGETSKGPAGVGPANG